MTSLAEQLKSIHLEGGGGASKPKPLRDLDKAKAPFLKGHHTPSTADVATLDSINLKSLKRPFRHECEIIYLKVRSVALCNGMTANVQDADVDTGLVWSLIEYPFPGGRKSMLPGTVIAIKEPYYGIDLNGNSAVCVHHPGDIVRVSKYDGAVQSHFPDHAGKKDIDFAKAAGAECALQKFMKAVDIYSEGIKQARSTIAVPADPTTFLDLLKGRANSLLELRLYDQAAVDAQDIIRRELSRTDGRVVSVQGVEIAMNMDNIRLATKIMIAAGKDTIALRYAKLLLRMDAHDATNLDLYVQAELKVQQQKGNINLGALAKSVQDSKLVPNVPTFVGNIAVRLSKLSGRGWFAKSYIRQGDLLLCEKPIALCSDFTNSSFKHGLHDVLIPKGGWIKQSSMSFLNDLAAATKDKPLLEDLHGLFDGKSTQASLTFDTYRALNIVHHNAFGIHAGNMSSMHHTQDPQYNGPFNAPTAARALRKFGSLFNHSCVPNAAYTWVANLMVVRAAQDIKQDEEITITYLNREWPYSYRVRHLLSFNMICECALCQADRGSEDDIAYHNLKLREDYQISHLDGGKWILRSTEEKEANVRGCLATYDLNIPDNVPYLGISSMIFHLAHSYLGPSREWPQASKETKAKAGACFIAALELCYGVILVKDSASPYCELAFANHAQPMPYVVLALIALADLAYLSSDSVEVARVAELLKCAKFVYLLCYGENATFDGHHKGYRCMTAKTHENATKAPENWTEIETMALTKPREFPSFLR